MTDWLVGAWIDWVYRYYLAVTTLNGFSQSLSGTFCACVYICKENSQYTLDFSILGVLENVLNKLPKPQ